MSRRPITIVQGAQYGSEAKGAIAGYLCEKEGVDVAVRTGATNAGHTVYYKGKPYKMQQLPVGWVNPDVKLVLGAGTLIDPEILDREVAMVNEAMPEQNVRDRLWIDYHAGLHLAQHAVRSRESGRHERIGATGKGCSEALIDRIRGRGEGAATFEQTGYSSGYHTLDTASALNHWYDQGQKILLEGTQGTMLDINLGPYPYTTHKPTGAAQWLMECGLSPALPLDIVLVVRTFPIRVAGNSGPLPLEMSWTQLAYQINAKRSKLGFDPIVSQEDLNTFEEAVRLSASSYSVPTWSDGLDMHSWSSRIRLEYAEAASRLHQTAFKICGPEVTERLGKLFERTTVTNKLRRIANLETQTLVKSGYLNRPHRVAVTFMNYLFPQYWFQPPPRFDPNVEQISSGISDILGAPVTLESFGPESSHVVAR